MVKLTGMNSLARLNPVLPAKERIIVTHSIEDRWDDKIGFYQVVINKIKGLEWNVGLEYDYEGYVSKLNEDILQGKFA